MNVPKKTNDVAVEFTTVDAVMASGGTTRRTDAFILTWVKMEKQLRRLFCFLVYQNPAFSKQDEDAIVKVIVDHKHLYFASFITCINKLGAPYVRDLVGPQYDHFQTEIKRIKGYRNKILHGQITGQKLQSPQLEKDTKVLRSWITVLASGAEAVLGYNGVGRNTFAKAKKASLSIKNNYPFVTVHEFRQWLDTNAG